jgi:RNA polymerase sigma factor (sigma-70 family)
LLGNLRVLYRVGSLVGLTDLQLLERFQSASSAGDHDAAQAALTTLVERHAAMVWNVCRSLTRDRHDAEDAFQATFLILVRKVGSLRVGGTLGPWLHVVAYRTALGVRASAARRREIERAAASRFEAVEPADGDASSTPAHELLAAIHAEIGILPEAFRAVVVLCDLEGLSYLEAAGRLKIPLGTVQSRLARARRRLRRSLTVKGIHPSDSGEARDPSGAAVLGSLNAGGPPTSLIDRVGRLGALIASDPACLKTSVAGSVQALIKGGLRSMWLGKLRQRLVVSLVGAVVGGTVLYASPSVVQTEKGRPERRQAEVERRIETPAPRGLRVASGRGKILLYELDEKVERVPVRPGVKDGPFRETQRETHWAVVTGVIDHDQVPKAWIQAARKSLPNAESIYLRVELQRRTLQKDGTWSGWKMIDMTANYAILDNTPAVEEERVPQAYRVGNLVDPLPFLTQGRWHGVDVEEFLPNGDEGQKDRRAINVPHPGPHRDLPPLLMIRAIDFTVGPGQVYRYRARVILMNPYFDRYRHRDRKFLEGPWSEATDVITIPTP